MHKVSDALLGLVRQPVEALGYELVGVELLGKGGGRQLLRVYIDHADGINLDDCGAVSHQLSGVLDVEEPIDGAYDLEVSSPGLDRLLFEPAHFERFTGRPARLRLAPPLDGRRKLQGRLMGVDGDTVLIEEEGELLRIPLGQIDTARLVPDI